MDGLMENPIKMDDLGVPLFSETSIYSSHFWLIHLKESSLFPAEKRTSNLPIFPLRDSIVRLVTQEEIGIFSWI